MSLNNDADVDLTPNALFDPSLVDVNPDTVDPRKTPTVLVSDTSTVLSPEQKDAAEKEAVDSLEGHVSFQVVTDQVTKTVDLQDIVDEFADKTVVSRSDAEYAAISFENLLSGDLRLNEFSISPSTANLPILRTKMNRELSTEQAKTVDIVDQFAKTSLQALYKSAEVFSNTDGDAMSEMIQVTHETCKSWMDAREGNVFFVRHENSMMPLTRTALCDINIEDISVTEERRAVIRNVVEIGKHFTNGALRSFATRIIQEFQAEELLKDSSTMYPREHVTLETLIMMFASKGILSLAEGASKVANECMVDITKIINAHNESGDSYEKVSDFVSKHGESINKNTALIHKLAEIVQGVGSLCPSMIAFIEETNKPG